MVHYSKAGQQLKVYWGEEPTFADELDGRDRVTILRAFECSDLIQGCKIWGIPEVVPNFDPNQACVNSPAFRPFAYYDRASDTMLIRWLPGELVVERQDDQGGHPLTMILNAQPQHEDRQSQRPWLLVGVKVHKLSTVMPIAPA
jgi:hypothetical protein